MHFPTSDTNTASTKTKITTTTFISHSVTKIAGLLFG